jgi:hypothetical protein
MVLIMQNRELGATFSQPTKVDVAGGLKSRKRML